MYARLRIERSTANFEQLQPCRSHTLRCLRLVTKRCNEFADAVLYRTIVLEEDTVSQERASYRFIERLLDPRDPLRHHVRFVHIKSFKGDEDSSCMNTKLLLECLHNVQKLDSFRSANFLLYHTLLLSY
jgi:hypothetical protein